MAALCLSSSFLSPFGKPASCRGRPFRRESNTGTQLPFLLFLEPFSGALGHFQQLSFLCVPTRGLSVSPSELRDLAQSRTTLSSLGYPGAFAEKCKMVINEIGALGPAVAAEYLAVRPNVWLNPEDRGAIQSQIPGCFKDPITFLSSQYFLNSSTN